MQLHYCPTCIQMTNHEITCMECLRGGEMYEKGREDMRKEMEETKKAREEYKKGNVIPDEDVRGTNKK